ncbi:CBS domain-containing protein [Winogradskyella sp.]|jgi:CBS domain-containing protein|uniref:CBS domain-containing protein n=1 Tax=Winogradskyella sp. TaxID=1883156 RepID=UPI0025D1CF3B|nr:CBS domain-containing protein [Winogradskyella sp.]MCT4629336.1 CBS domain-containing protein [Winogradskyella sp.]
MGRLDIRQLKSPKEKALYIHHLIKDLETLDIMLKEDLIEKEPIRIGAEQEFCVTTNQFFPNNNNIEVLEAINDSHFTTEIGKYNLEINSDPLTLEGDCFSLLYQQLKELFKKAGKVAKTKDSKVVLTGILPTLRLKHIAENYLTDRSRYHVLNNSLKSSRREHFNIHIKGVDELNLIHDCVMLEACNTSFQMHLQIHPNEFVDKYNWAQAISGPVLSVCANSPILFGRELWAETRIAVFTQSIDTRRNSFIHKEKQSRVSFGADWEKGTVTDIFRDHISRFRSLLTSTEHDDSLEKLNKGEIPKLRALQLHNGTVYKWNRVCYGVGGGKPHLRIECRYIPAGPTLTDEIANMVFWVGLMLGQPEYYKNIHDKMDFKDIKKNFFKAARYGMETQFRWNNELLSAKDLILNEFIPIAREGLKKANISTKDITKYLTIIKKRVLSNNGSQWMVNNYRNLQKTKTNFEALQNITAYMYKHQLEEKTVDEWDIFNPDDNLKIDVSRIVKHNMNTKILLVNQSDSLELVSSIMKWKNIHHLPVINNKKELTGLLTWTDLIKLGNKDLHLCVKDVMTKDLITTSQETPLKEAKSLMELNNINCLPVVRNKELLGILTSSDF